LTAGKNRNKNVVKFWANGDRIYAARFI